jgi:hypothetical protein
MDGARCVVDMLDRPATGEAQEIYQSTRRELQRKEVATH